MGFGPSLDLAGLEGLAGFAEALGDEVFGPANTSGRFSRLGASAVSFWAFLVPGLRQKIPEAQEMGMGVSVQECWRLGYFGRTSRSSFELGGQSGPTRQRPDLDREAGRRHRGRRST